MLNNPIRNQNEVLRNIQLTQKEKQGQKTKGKWKTNSKMMNLNPTKAITTLNVNTLSTTMKSRDCQPGQ